MELIQLVNSGVPGKLVELMRDRKIEGKDATVCLLGAFGIAAVIWCWKYAVDHNYHLSEAKSHDEENEVKDTKSVKSKR